MKLSQLTSALRSEPLSRLAREAAWRTVRSTRKARFRIAGTQGGNAVRFYPIGYYQLQKEAVSARDWQSLVDYADAIVAGNYPLLGYGSPSLGSHPNWHCDWVSGKSWPVEPSGRLRIVKHDGSDVKAPWELSRLQWSPVVAKAWVLTGDLRYRTVLQSLLTDWISNNPIGKGVHWTVAMEAALRGVSLCLTMELLWPFTEAEQPWLTLLEKSLWQHLRFIEVHSEFSWLVRSNHYLSNLVGLATLSACLRGAGMQRRLERYAHAVQQEVVLQTYADGGDREASTGYHVLVAQMALHSLIVQRRAACVPAPAFEAGVRRMFAWIATLADDAWTLPALGDCDNGRVELLLDDIAQAGLAASDRHALKVGGLAGLAAHVLQLPLGGRQQDAVWFGAQTTAPLVKRALDPLSILLDSGVAVLRARDASVIFCAMPNGLSGKGSHTHCDKLSFILRLQASSTSHEVFCDTGSRGYTRSAEQRNIDRSTRAHNTLAIDRADQNTISGQLDHLFRTGNEAAVSLLVRLLSEPTTVQASHRGYARYGIEHQRTVALGEGSLHLVDQVTGPTGDRDHQLDLHFILGPEWTVSSEMMTGEKVSCLITGLRQLTLECTSTSQLTLTLAPAEISREYGAALPGTSIAIRTSTSLPANLRTTIHWE